MKIKRELNTKDAVYDLTGLTNDEFRRIVISVEHYAMYAQRHMDDDLTQKLRKMADSSVSII